MAGIHITDIEAAINWWRERSPSPDNISACAEVRALAEVYALMVYHHESECDEHSMPTRAHEAWLGWYATTPDAPCIAICSTSQGDDWCKGCGRSFDEVQHWPVMSPGEKRATWRRITQDGSAWRFNRYAERAPDVVLAPATTANPAEADTPSAGPAALASDASSLPVPEVPPQAPPAPEAPPEGLEPVAATVALPPAAPDTEPDTAPADQAAAQADHGDAVHSDAASAEPEPSLGVADELVDALPASPAASAVLVLPPPTRARKGLRAWWARWVLRRRAG